jgi:hypothetical protein
LKEERIMMNLNGTDIGRKLKLVVATIGQQEMFVTLFVSLLWSVVQAIINLLSISGV